MVETVRALWSAVRRRDRAADGLFVYAVTSTRVYCRPSCPSRRPSRERVEFFPTPAAARAAGYRSCRRCHPDAPVASPPHGHRVRLACEAIARAPMARWTTRRIAEAGQASVPQLQRAFRSLLGLAPRDYVAACRRRRFLEGLRGGKEVTRAVYEAGYGSPSRAYDAKRRGGVTPATYAKGGRGIAIDWLTVASPVGRILVAATDKGLCFVEVGRTLTDLRAALRAEFPHATIAARPAGRLRPMARAARAVATAHTPPANLPVDVRGTAFQWRVWQALASIPPGETTTYAKLARRIGAPTSTRAVARACATNPLALIVPCHRVVGADGSLRGYRWGVQVKDALLAAERQQG
jgi:AraC family transcriptional regulator, regulatory protein of adaptative response / methylated-DNA-[protein]-cysteine methyltransferase